MPNGAAGTLLNVMRLLGGLGLLASVAFIVVLLAAPFAVGPQSDPAVQSALSAVAAATINAACALRRENRLGSIETGKQADLAVYDVTDYREIPYFGAYAGGAASKCFERRLA